MTCDYCQEAESNPRSPKFRGDCLGCAARALAASPDHWQSRRDQKMTDGYKAALRRTYGGDWQAGHERVKAWAERMSRQPVDDVTGLPAGHERRV